jgi:Sec-independent protein translocase protein TatA
MFAFLENLSMTEIMVVIVIAVIVFGGRLPEAAGEAAAQLHKLRRTLGDLKRDTGIDREIAEMRRNVEQAIPRMPRIVDVPHTIERRLEAVAREADAAATKALEEPKSTAADDAAHAAGAANGAAHRAPEGATPTSPAATPPAESEPLQ